jgi:hypothetical protein
MPVFSPSVRQKSLGLDFPDRFMASTSFSVNPDAAGPSFTK